MNIGTMGRTRSTRAISEKRTGSNFSKSAEVQDTLELPSCSAQFRNWKSFTNSREGRIARSNTNPQQSNKGIRFFCIERSVLGELKNEPESAFVMRRCRIDFTDNCV